MLSDGTLSEEEVIKLRGWLAQNSATDIPGIAFLTETIERVLSDGIISESERTELHLAMEKVLPVTERSEAKAARARLPKARSTSPSLDDRISKDDLRKLKDEEADVEAIEFGRWWRDDGMTEAQRRFIKSLRGSISPNATKGEASDLISKLLKERPLSSRQLMVLRFWKRPQSPGEGPYEISVWLDEFHTEDPDRKAAWELFKQECEVNGLQGNPNRVPLGIGPEYLARVKKGGEAAIPKFLNNPLHQQRSTTRPRNRTGLICLFALFVAALFLLAWFQLNRTSPAPEIGSTTATVAEKVVDQKSELAPATLYLAWKMSTGPNSAPLHLLFLGCALVALWAVKNREL